jgi:hypothetical protein
MIDNSREIETSEKSRDPSERLPSPLPATIVGLGVPEAPPAGASVYADDSPSRPGAKQTLVGFPTPPCGDELEPQAGAFSDGLADANDDDDEVTVVGGYDEVTVVTPWDSRALARVLAENRAAQAPEASDPSVGGEDDLDGAWPESPLDTAPEAAPASAELPEAPPATAFTEVQENLPVTAREPKLNTALADAPPQVGEGLLPETQKLTGQTAALRLAADADASAEQAEPEETSSPDDVTAPLSLRAFSKPPPPPRPTERRSRTETLPPPSSDRDLFVSRDTELQIFAPPIEMFGPSTGRSLSERDTVPPLAPSAVHTQSDAPWYRPAERESMLPPRRSRGVRIALIGAATALLGAGVAVTGGLLPKSGRVLVTVSGPLDAPVSGASVLVDGKPRCAPAPCRITLDEGAYVLAVSAPSYRRAAEKSLSVTPGAEEAVHFTLLPNDTSGIEVRSEVAGLQVLVDGLARGTTPTTVRGLSAGKHSIQIVGNARYASIETELELETDKVAVFEPKLSPQPEIVAAEELEPKAGPAPEASLVSAPALAAPVAAPAPAAHLPPALAKALRPAGNAAPVAAAKVDLDTPDAAPAVALSKLTITSTPPSNVVVDGRPLGSTPREIEVSPGDHSVVFVHPTKGRKSVRVRAQGGKAASASVSF